MERLTPKDIKTVSYSTWELCGLDHECKRDCWKPTPCKVPKIIRRLASLEDLLDSGELVRVVRCKDCIHSEKINPKEYKDIYPNVFHCKVWRGDETKNCWNSKTKEYADFSTVWDDGYCSEGELDCGAKMDGPTKINGGTTNV